MSADLGPVLIATILFVLLTPGLLFQLPSKEGRGIACHNMQTSGISIVVHTILFLGFICIFFLAIGVHIWVG
ncbi:hypothetical protein ACHQM5_008079 [Ranunculus cassubicifolius]